MSEKATAEELPLKTVLARTILDDLAARKVSLKQAADTADVSYVRLYRMHSGDLRKFSIGWLLRVAERAGVKLRIRVELM